MDSYFTAALLFKMYRFDYLLPLSMRLCFLSYFLPGSLFACLSAAWQVKKV